MINVQAVVLKLLLSCTDKELALACFDKIKPHFFSSSYSTIHKAIKKFYQDHGKIPSMDELGVKFSRNTQLQVALSTLQQLDDLDIDFEMAIDALRNEYAQQETLNLISKSILEDIGMCTAEDIVDRLAALPLKLEEQLDDSGNLVSASQIPIFQNEDEEDMEMIYTGISNEWDSKFGGVGRQEFILLGGRTGSGKSVCCSNLQVQQYYAGNVAPYFSIEMSAREVLLRNLSIMAGVNAMKAKQKRLEGDELLKLALTRAKMFHGGAEAYKNFVRNKNNLKFSDFFELDSALMKNHEEIHPMLIYDDSNLRLSTIDVTLSKLIGLHGKKVTMSIVDYINETRMDDKSDPYDWVYQLELSRGFKSLARKHDVAMVSPYQLNDDGNARFSKAILVPVDIALNLEADTAAGCIDFKTSKVRSLPNCAFNSAMDWTSLRLSPEPLSEEERTANTEDFREKSVQDNKERDANELAY